MLKLCMLLWYASDLSVKTASVDFRIVLCCVRPSPYVIAADVHYKYVCFFIKRARIRSSLPRSNPAVRSMRFWFDFLHKQHKHLKRFGEIFEFGLLFGGCLKGCFALYYHHVVLKGSRGRQMWADRHWLDYRKDDNARSSLVLHLFLSLLYCSLCERNILAHFVPCRWLLNNVYDQRIQCSSLNMQMWSECSCVSRQTKERQNHWWFLIQTITAFCRELQVECNLTLHTISI